MGFPLSSNSISNSTNHVAEAVSDGRGNSGNVLTEASAGTHVVDTGDGPSGLDAEGWVSDSLGGGAVADLGGAAFVVVVSSSGATISIRSGLTASE